MTTYQKETIYDESKMESMQNNVKREQSERKAECANQTLESKTDEWHLYLVDVRGGV